MMNTRLREELEHVLHNSPEYNALFAAIRAGKDLTELYVLAEEAGVTKSEVSEFQTIAAMAARNRPAALKLRELERQVRKLDGQAGGLSKRLNNSVLTEAEKRDLSTKLDEVFQQRDAMRWDLAAARGGATQVEGAAKMNLADPLPADDPSEK